MVFSRIISSDGIPRDHQTSNRLEVMEARFHVGDFAGPPAEAQLPSTKNHFWKEGSAG